jgi:hypothetical protein
VETTELVPEPPPRRRPRTYRVFRRVLGGRAAPHPATAPPPDLQAEPGFQRLSNALARADAAANDLGALHRSHQVILLALAILTALAGASSALWPGLEAAWVAAELALALMAVAIWRDSERAHRHQRWGEARRLAEDLRLERAAWTLGISTTSFSSNLASVARAHRERRLAGLPTGAFHSARVESWGLWTLDDLIHGQAHYHRSQALLNGRIAHRIHLLENGAGFALLAVLGAYLATWAVMLGLHGEPPVWLTNMVFVAGTVVPAIAAASIALEATLALGEESQRSLTLSAQLDDLVTERPEDGLQGYQRLAKEAIRLQRAQEDRWAEGWVRRRLVRPG